VADGAHLHFAEVLDRLAGEDPLTGSTTKLRWVVPGRVWLLPGRDQVATSAVHPSGSRSSGADDGIRTRDPHHGKVMLYH
jgi:hypothetical protein